MSTKTSALWAKHHQQWSDSYRELERVANEEFPPGTKVKFQKGPNTLTGVVMDNHGYQSTTIRVKTKTGAEHRVDCQYLKFASAIDAARSKSTPAAKE